MLVQARTGHFFFSSSFFGSRHAEAWNVRRDPLLLCCLSRNSEARRPQEDLAWRARYWYDVWARSGKSCEGNGAEWPCISRQEVEKRDSFDEICTAWRAPRELSISSSAVERPQQSTFVSSPLLRAECGMRIWTRLWYRSWQDQRTNARRKRRNFEEVIWHAGLSTRLRKSLASSGTGWAIDAANRGSMQDPEEAGRAGPSGLEAIHAEASCIQCTCLARWGGCAPYPVDTPCWTRIQQDEGHYGGSSDSETRVRLTRTGSD